MPIILPNLDDREYADLVAEAKALIPQYAPSWTDHNPSDPGITLIELFAYICEMLMYRNDQVTEENKRMFLKILMGGDWLDKPEQSGIPVNQLIQSAIAELRTEERAITNSDFESYALKASKGKVTRVYCRARRNYEDVSHIGKDVLGHVSLMIIPAEAPYNVLKDQIKNMIVNDLEPRLLLTTRLHVVAANYVPISVEMKLKIAEDYRPQNVADAVCNKLAVFFDPVKGDKDEQGWKPGQNIYLSDIYSLLDRVPGVDYVESLSVIKENDKLSSGKGIQYSVINFSENELPLFDEEKKRLTITNWIAFVAK
jgi:hypothetical protein